MIRRHVSAVVRATDGFTGSEMKAGKLCCLLDGQPVAPLSKPRGYLVFSDVEPGEHTLTLSGSPYLPRKVCFAAREDQTCYLWAAMQPGPAYPLPSSALRLELNMTMGGTPLSDEPVWAAVPRRETQLLVAQDTVLPGEQQLRIYCRGRLERLPVPGGYLFLDREATEAGTLLSLTQEQAVLEQPLTGTHSRNVELCPAQWETTDQTGRLYLTLRSRGQVHLYLPRRKAWKLLDLQQEPLPQTIDF